MGEINAAIANWGDVPTWVSKIIAIFALVISCGSAVLSWKSLRWERLSAEAATRSAEADERSNRLTERAILGDHDYPDNQAECMASRTPAVRWQIEHPSDNRYVLRNVGADVAEHVEVDNPAAGVIARNLPQDAVVRPGEGVDILLMGTWGHPIPNQLYVRWTGQQKWVAVPINDD